MQTLSAVIITQDEERNIARCLDSLRDLADEIIVVDSGSTDRTETICRQYGCRLGTKFVHHQWVNYSDQKNFANSLASGDWILSIDADEAISLELNANIRAIKTIEHPANTVFSINRLTNYCGHWVHHCGWYPDRKIRIWQRGQAEWFGTVHEELHLPDNATVQQLDGDLLHYSYYTIDEHRTRTTKYAKLMARQRFENGLSCSRLDIILKPLWAFVRTLLLQGGILDGWAGWQIAKVTANYTRTKYSELYTLYHQNETSTNKK